MKNAALLALAFAVPSLAFAATFSRNLQFGSMGADVAQLQRVLNQDPLTQVAASGPGSPGNETEYFGPATARAVAKFQEKYRSQVLVPNNLVSGTGFVGMSTRAVLAQIKSPIIQTVPQASSTQGFTSQPPNDPNNLHEVLAILDRAAARGEITPTDLPKFKKDVIEELSTTTDLVAAFLKQAKIVKVSTGTPLKERIIAFVGNLFFSVPRAEASTGTPFGGRIVSVFPCVCSGTYVIYMTPLGPSYPEALSYRAFSELYSAYNLPYSTALKGMYVPGTGICLVPGSPCSGSYPGRGMITPEVGSAPLP